MKITPIQVTIADLTKNYKDNGDGGVFGYDDRLTIRPSFQRCFCYSDKQRNLVIDSVMKGRPLNVMYWSKTGNNTYEVLDGQQRTISIAQYVNNDFPIKVNGNDKFFQNLTDTERDQILNYELIIYICEGTEEEKLEWFKIINIAGETLTSQELLNATYTGPWLADAKNYFSKRNCVAGQMADGYIKGNPIRQDYLEKALSWIADSQGLASGQMYMAVHQHDIDANELWIYFQSVINWAQRLFPEKKKGITDVQEWGILYNKYRNVTYNSNTLKNELQTLILDDDVTSNSGIIPYILSPRTKSDEKSLSIRAFSAGQKIKAYEKQRGICPICGKHFELDEMQGDHIVPWSQGGHTTVDNLQMLCKRCNAEKAAK